MRPFTAAKRLPSGAIDCIGDTMHRPRRAGMAIAFGRCKHAAVDRA